MDVAQAYGELLRAEGRLAIVRLSRDDAADVARVTADFARIGQGRQAEAERAATELERPRGRLARGRSRSYSDVRNPRGIARHSDRHSAPLGGALVGAAIDRPRPDSPARTVGDGCLPQAGARRAAGRDSCFFTATPSVEDSAVLATNYGRL